MTTAMAIDSPARELAAKLVSFFETGTAPEGLFAPDVFCDLSLPHWRLQSEGPDGLVALRKAGHPAPGSVVRTLLDETSTGFVLEFEERWHDEQGSWYSREIARADVGERGISELSVYCTGDWSEVHEADHRAAVRLVRP